MTRLFDLDDTPQAPTWTGTRLPAIYTGSATCTHCAAGTLVTLPRFAEVPLFAMYGHGGTITRTMRICLACRRVSEASMETSRPDTLIPVG